ncbi:MAG: OmpA family protein, partial [Spirochaetia bacterium]
SGPTFRLGTSPTPFSPDDDGENDVVRIAMSGVTDASRIVDWRIDIFDPRGNPFYQRSGSGRPPASIQWDGYSSDRELVQAAEDYLVHATLTDALGNVGEEREILPIDVLVLRDGANLKIRISSIQFAPNSADFLGFDAEKAERNLRTLTRLAEILRKYAGYEIRIEGHAVSVFWNDPVRARREETEELAPLSKARAEAVKSGLVDLGIPAAQMTTVGMGGTQPLVPHGDLENRWKSRRVEFILIR